MGVQVGSETGETVGDRFRGGRIVNMSGSVDCLARPCKCVVFFFNLCFGV